MELNVGESFMLMGMRICWRMSLSRSITPLHLRSGLFDIGGDVVDVEFQGVGSGLLQFLAGFHPAARGDAVEAGDDRNVDGLFQRLEVFQVEVQAMGEVLVVGEEAPGLGESGVLMVQKADHGFRLGGHRLLE